MDNLSWNAQMKRQGAKKMRHTFITLSILTSSFIFVAAAHAQLAIPPNANAGLIQNHYLQQQFMQNNMPWLNGPITEADYKPPKNDEPLIQFMNADVEGMIIQKNDKTGDVRIEAAPKL